MENTTALTPLLPLLDLVQANFFTTLFPDTANVRSMVPFKTDVPPNVAFAANTRTTLPDFEVVAAVLDFTVTPEGSVPTVQVHATCSIPS